MKAALSIVTSEKQAEIREAWNLIAEKKGALRKKSVFRVFRALGMAPTDLEFQDLFQRMEPKYGKVEFSEFSHVVEDLLDASFNVEKVQEAFELFDRDRKQFFDQDDLARVMRTLNERLTEEQIVDMILEVDCQGDLRINRDEFLDLMAG
ncbi:hypothetical protein M885DRAFT_530783 [Pelagophyceae sp. CCMP2097]|nr:hypothetical protein M885DRAFT_530783 [Pelagophyceae sp. CCMP2097]